MAIKEHLNILKSGSEVWNTWIVKNWKEMEANLIQAGQDTYRPATAADLSNTDLTEFGDLYITGSSQQLGMWNGAFPLRMTKGFSRAGLYWYVYIPGILNQEIEYKCLYGPGKWVSGDNQKYIPTQALQAENSDFHAELLNAK